MTCVGALILPMFSWRECLDFSSTISKNTRVGGQGRSQSYVGGTLQAAPVTPVGTSPWAGAMG